MQKKLSVDFGFVEHKFSVDWEFADRVIEFVDMKYENFKPDVTYTPEELIGFYTWSEMTPHEKDLAVIVLKISASGGNLPLVEVPISPGTVFMLKQSNCESR